MFEHARTRKRVITVAVAVTATMTVPVVTASEAAAAPPQPTIRTIAGQASSPGFAGDGGPAQYSQLSSPRALAVAPSGDVFIADYYNQRVRKIDAAGSMSTANFSVCASALAHSAGSLLIGDDCGYRITRVVGTVATPVAGNGSYGSSPDGAPAATSSVGGPYAVAESHDGIYFVDSSSVRRITRTGFLTTVSTTGCPSGLAADAAGTVYVADWCSHTVWKVTPNGRSAVAGTYNTAGYSGDGGLATSATLANPTGVAVDALGNLYIADYGNRRVRRVSPDGTIDTVAGNGLSGVSGDGGPAVLAAIGRPIGVAVGPTGTLYVSDSENHVVRAVRTDFAAEAIGEQYPFASDSCAAGTTVAAGAADDGTTARVSVVQPASGSASVCVRVDGSAVRAGGRFDVSADELEVLGVDDDAGACTTTPGNTVPGPHPAVGVDIGDPNDPPFVPVRFDSYANDRDAWVCVLAGDLLYRVRLRAVVGDVPTVAFVADPPGAAHDAGIGTPTANPSGSCEAAGGERVLDVDADGSRTFMYVDGRDPAKICVATSGFANAGGVLTVSTADVSAMAPVKIRENAPTRPCTAQVVHSTTPEITIRRTAPGALPAAICVETPGRTIDVIVEPGSTGVPVVATWTPDPGTPGLP